MSDPPRLVERSSSALATRLLRAGRGEGPSDAMVRRTLAAAGAGVAATLSTAAAAGKSTGVALSGASAGVIAHAGGSATLLLAAKWIGVGTIAGLLTVTAATRLGPEIGSRSDGAHVRSHAEIAPSVVVESANPARTVGDHALEADEQPPLVQPSPSRELPDRTVPRAESWAPPSNPVVPVAEAPPSAPEKTRLADPPMPLAEEVAFVDHGWTTIRLGQYARTLADLDAYERRFPTLSLYPEVLFLRMESESQLGRKEPAKDYARRILSGYPKSTHTARARDVLAK